MSVDSMGNIRITADPQKIKPGMIYVDLSGKKRRENIYKAYSNGASLIFTSYNITDPELPVIKVKNPQDILRIMIDRFFGDREYQAKLIGLFGEGEKSVLIELVQIILYGETNIDRIKKWSGHKKYLDNKYNIEDFFSAFIDMYKSGMDIIPISINSSTSDIIDIILNGNVNIDCAILTDKSSIERNPGGLSIARYLSTIPEKKLILVNNDEIDKENMLAENTKARLITYGLNKKAHVSASSIDINETVCFNYCVQKQFPTVSGKRIEPFEIPVCLNALGSHNIYNALAAITCGLYYDKEIAGIKSLVESYKAPERHFQKIYDGDFTIIDNCCSSMHDYLIAFDSIQILSYEGLILVISVSQDSNLAIQEEKARLISEWIRILKCREVILTSCMDGDNRTGELPLRSMRVYKQVFKDNGVPFRYYHLLEHALERGLSLLSKRDLLVLLGSDEMDIAKSIISKKLKPAPEVRH